MSNDSPSYSPLNAARVEHVLERVRPWLHADGGDVDLVEVDAEGFVHLHMLGACGGCPMSSLTLVQGIEHELRREFGPALAGVIPVD